MTSRPRVKASATRLNAASILALAAFGLFWLVAAFLRGVPGWVGAVYAVSSLACFAAYAIDKFAAARGRRRLRESTLLALGLAGGWPGAVLAQEGLRHKSAKRSFRVRFWTTVVLNSGAFVAASLLIRPGR